MTIYKENTQQEGQIVYYQSHELVTQYFFTYPLWAIVTILVCVEIVIWADHLPIFLTKFTKFLFLFFEVFPNTQIDTATLKKQ